MRVLHFAAVAALLVGCGGVDVVEDDDDGAGGAPATSTGDVASTGATPVGPGASGVSSTSTGAGAGSSQSGTGGSGDGGAGVGGDGVGGDGDGGSGVGGDGSGGFSCELTCGQQELCDGSHGGFDDDCDGEVDEGCPCVPGERRSCFEGDPTYLDVAGCFAGSMVCGEDGEWGACFGGAHPVGGGSCVEDESGCHAISAWPYQPIDLHAGLGSFGGGADSETFEVACPDGVDCPDALLGDFRGLQAGRYEITYTKVDGGDAESCTFPLDVVSRGLSVELSWNFAVASDLDLHLMEPGVATAFNSGGSASDCTWNNCQIDFFNDGSGPEWFPSDAPLGDPVAWYRNDDEELNSCYYAPRGKGATWQNADRGCHNPRIDVDNVSCSTSITNPDDPQFCAPENVNIDFPPVGEWMRIAAVAYSGATAQPKLRIFCDGELRAELGPEGYSAPVSLSNSNSKPVWIAADVAYVDDGCGGRECLIEPIYLNNGDNDPWIIPAPAGGPALPPDP